MRHIFPANTEIDQLRREQLLYQRAKVIWFTGLPCAGKSTLAIQLGSQLNQLGFKTYLLDGDHIRSGLNSDLSFTDADRKENIRRIGEVSRLFCDAGIIVLTAVISPFHADRLSVRQTVGCENYIEVFVDCPLEVCEERDVKGMYRKARAGELKNFTGIDSPYERPQSPDQIMPTAEISIEECTRRLSAFILPRISLARTRNGVIHQ